MGVSVTHPAERMLAVVSQVEQSLNSDDTAFERGASTNLSVRLDIVRSLAHEPFDAEDLAERLVRDALQD